MQVEPDGQATDCKPVSSKFDSCRLLQKVVDIFSLLMQNYVLVGCSLRSYLQVLSESYVKSGHEAQKVDCHCKSLVTPTLSLADTRFNNCHFAPFVYRLGHCPFTAGRRGSIPPRSTISCVVMENLVYPIMHSHCWLCVHATSTSWTTTRQRLITRYSKRRTVKANE